MLFNYGSHVLYTCRLLLCLLWESYGLWVLGRGRRVLVIVMGWWVERWWWVELTMVCCCGRLGWWLCVSGSTSALVNASSRIRCWRCGSSCWCAGAWGNMKNGDAHDVMKVKCKNWIIILNEGKEKYMYSHCWVWVRVSVTWRWAVGAKKSEKSVWFGDGRTTRMKFSGVIKPIAWYYDHRAMAFGDGHLVHRVKLGHGAHWVQWGP